MKASSLELLRNLLGEPMLTPDAVRHVDFDSCTVTLKSGRKLKSAAGDPDYMFSAACFDAFRGHDIGFTIGLNSFS